MYLHAMGLCEIWTVNGTRKWLFHAPAAAAPAPADTRVYPFLTSITVTQERNCITTFQVSLDAPREEGIKMLSEDVNGGSPFNVQNVVRVSMGYPAQNLWTPWYYGLIQQGGEGIEITPTGVGGTLSVQQCNWQDGHVAKGSFSYSSSAEGLLTNVTKLMGVATLISGGAREALNKATARYFGQPWIVGNRTNMEVLRWLCTLTGVIMIMHNVNNDGQPACLEFMLRAEASQFGRKEEQVVNKYMMCGRFDPMANEYPILSWGPEAGVASWAGTTPSPSNEGMASAVVNKMTGKVITTKVDAGTTTNPTYGDQKAKGPAQERTTAEGKVVGREVDGKTAVPSYLSDPGGLASTDAATEQESINRQVMLMSQGNMAQIATLTTIGVPTQGIWKKIFVIGCSARYDGPYMVQGITHRWSADGYETELKVFREGVFGTNEDAKALVKGEQLTKD